MRVLIILCTFNGEAFLKEQLNSLERQTHENWELLVSDDASTDKTLSIVTEFQNRMGPERVSIINGPCKGYALNFVSACFHANPNSDLYAFCDQDDIWKPEKLETAIKSLQGYPADKPTLYCSRTELIDENGAHIGYSRFFPNPPSFSNAVVQSLAGGNTMVFNKAAKDLIQQLRFCSELVAHDWAMYQLVTGVDGKIIYDSWASILYRQHNSNMIGSNLGFRARLTRLKMLLSGQMKEWNRRNIECISVMEDQLCGEARR